MSADEKHAATYLGGQYTPSTRAVRETFAYTGMSESEAYLRAAFDRWLETVRAEAKAEAWDECARSIVYEDGTPVEIVSITNPYKEGAANGR